MQSGSEGLNAAQSVGFFAAAALGFLLGAFGCSASLDGAGRASTPAPNALADASVEVPASAYETLLHDLDPGPVAALDAVAPAGLVAAATGNGYTQTDVVKMFTDVWGKGGETKIEWRGGGMPPDQVVSISLIALLSLEADRTAGRPCDLACKTALTRGYGFYSALRDLDSDDLIGVLLTRLGWRGQLDESQEAQFTAFFESLISASPQRLRAAALEILRSDPSSPEALEALTLVARSENISGNYAFAARLYGEVVQRADASVEADRFVTAAKVCYRIPDIACGNAYRERAASLGISDSDNERLLFMENRANDLQKPADLSTFESRLARADIDFALERDVEAFALYRGLMADYPNDARGFVGSAKLDMRNLNWGSAFGTVVQAGTEHRGADFYHVALGTWFVGAPLAVRDGDAEALGKNFLAKLPQLRALIGEYAPFDPGQSAWMSIALDLGLVLVQGPDDERVKALADARRRSAAADAKIPGSFDLAKMRIALATFDPDPRSALATITSVTKNHEPRQELTDLRRSVLLIRGVSRRDTAALTMLERELAAISRPTPAERSLRADVLGVRGKDWKAVDAAYAALDASSDSEAGDAARRVSNRAVALAHLGRIDEARGMWEPLVIVGADLPAPAFNLYATAPPSEREAALQKLNASAEVNSGAALETEIKAWTIAYATKDAAERKRKLKALDAAHEVATPYTAKERLYGTAIDKSIQLGLGFNDAAGLIPKIDIKGRSWLVIEPER